MIPVVFLTNPDDSSLPLIKKELQGLTKKFEESKFRDQINIQPRNDISPDSFSSVVRNYQHRIVLFHYAGHADARNLIFSEKNVTAEGVARFFKTESNLSLVFLNGCSTEGQVNYLFKKGVPAVIATRYPVLDSEAAKFANLFYQEWINNNKTLGQAFLNAFNDRNISTHSTKDSIQRGMGLITFEEPPFWKLYIHKDYPWVEDLSFEALIYNQLIGVPPVRSSITLKSDGRNHFKGLTPLQLNDAQVFFGRNREIRTLYKYYSEHNSNEVLLLYGKSGVGKSSLLQAGLLARLPEDTVRFIRIGESDFSLFVTEKLDKVKLLILDQFEKILETPEEQLSNIASFLQDRFQKGTKLIFSFRKDYLAEMLHLIEMWALPNRRLFLPPLSSTAIKEIVEFLHRIPQEKKDYFFVNPKGLGEAIATHLKDTEGSVAPVLQLLMKKMYAEAIEEQSTNLKKLDNPLFERVSERGLHIKDYLKTEIDLIEENPDFRGKNLGESGLIIDLLYYLCEPNYGLTKSVKYYALLDEYKDTPDFVKLLNHLKDRYLILIDERPALKNNQKQIQKYVRLVHDALAKEANRQFELSQLPGQQARRILQAKLKEENNFLNRKEYNWVKAGLYGRSRLSEEEEDLLKESKKALIYEARKSGALISISVVIVLAFILWWFFIQKPAQISTQLDQIQTEIELGNWGNVKTQYTKVLNSKQGKEHFLATLIRIPQLTSADQILELSRLSKSSNGALSQQIKAVAAFWLSYSPYWEKGKQILSKDTATVDTKEDLRQVARVNLPPYFQDSIRNLFPEFTEINPPVNTIDQCSSNQGNDLATFQMSIKEVSIQQFQIFLNASQASNDPYEGFEWDMNLQSWKIKDKDPRLPVEVTFEQAWDYCDWAGYHLPTTQQWEIAAADLLSQDQYTPSFIEARQEIIGKPGSGFIGSSLPNNYGLYDLLGNVSEWVSCEGTQTSRGGSYRLRIGDTIKRKTIIPLVDPYVDFTWGKGFRPVFNTIKPI